MVCKKLKLLDSIIAEMGSYCRPNTVTITIRTDRDSVTHGELIIDPELIAILMDRDRLQELLLKLTPAADGKPVESENPFIDAKNPFTESSENPEPAQHLSAIASGSSLGMSGTVPELTPDLAPIPVPVPVPIPVPAPIPGWFDTPDAVVDLPPIDLLEHVPVPMEPNPFEAISSSSNFTTILTILITLTNSLRPETSRYRTAILNLHKNTRKMPDSNFMMQTFLIMLGYDSVRLSTGSRLCELICARTRYRALNPAKYQIMQKILLSLRIDSVVGIDTIMHQVDCDFVQAKLAWSNVELKFGYIESVIVQITQLYPYYRMKLATSDGAMSILSAFRDIISETITDLDQLRSREIFGSCNVIGQKC